VKICTAMTTVSGRESSAPVDVWAELPIGSAVFIDTNVLLYTFASESAWHALARQRIQILQQSIAALWISRQVLRELLAAATRPGVLQEPNPVDRWLVAARELEGTMRIAEDDAQVTAHLLELLEAPGARGKQVHDANIVATMRRHEISYLLTHNTADFARYVPWIKTLPLAL
jgi:predicted nucleic acid-binding protein